MSGIPRTIEDSWGGNITTAAIAQLAHSTPEEYRFTSQLRDRQYRRRAPQRVQGYMEASREPGLGVRPKWDVIGPCVVDVH